jgi:hypothetical protein
MTSQLIDEVVSIYSLPTVDTKHCADIGATALMAAVNCSNVEIVTVLLLDPRVDRSLRENNLMTAREMPPRNRQIHQTVIRLFDAPAFLAEMATELNLNPAAQRIQVPAQGFLDAARDGNQDFVENYIREHRDHPELAVNARQAATVAQENGQLDLAMLITQLVISDQPAPQQNQPMHAEAKPADNSYQSQLEAIDFDFQNLPDEFKDPVHLGIIEEPVVIFSGHTIDRSSLAELINRNMPNPLTREPIDPGEIRRGTSIDIKNNIEKFIAEQKLMHAIARADQRLEQAPSSPDKDNDRAIQARLRKFGASSSEKSPSSSSDQHSMSRENKK